MATGGTIYPLTVSTEATSIHLYSLVSNGLRIQGTSVAARTSTRRMLEFAAMHGIKPVIMEWQMDKAGIEDAMEALRTRKVRYRAVLKA